MASSHPNSPSANQSTDPVLDLASHLRGLEEIAGKVEDAADLIKKVVLDADAVVQRLGPRLGVTVCHSLGCYATGPVPSSPILFDGVLEFEENMLIIDRWDGTQDHPGDRKWHILFGHVVLGPRDIDEQGPPSRGNVPESADEWDYLQPLASAKLEYRKQAIPHLQALFDAYVEQAGEHYGALLKANEAVRSFRSRIEQAEL